MIREVNISNNNPFAKKIEYLEKDISIGFLDYSLIYNRIEIDNIVVDEAYRNKGIGTKLIEFLINLAIKENIINITLEVRKSNKIARHLYEKMGFKEVATRKFYYGDEDAILMEKKVTQVEDTYILAIETSCDETSMSIIKNGHIEIATVVLSQIDIHKNFGGVVPEIASRNHIENITIVLDELMQKANMKIDDITAIAVTYGPGLIGSLLVGVQAAKTISLVTGKPLIPVHHIAGHIYANNLEKELSFPLIALVVSGGHTELIYMNEHYSFKRIGGTLDDAVGECYDKVAKVIGLEYPGGPKVDKLAHIGKDTYNLPYPLNDSTFNFSFSGIKSAVINLVHNEEQRENKINKENLCASFQDRVTTVLVKKTMRALKEYKVNNLIVAGGVSANSGLREKLEEECQQNNIILSFPPLKYCTDNAAMIGAAAYFAYKKGIIADQTLTAKAVDNLYKYE